MRPDARDMLPYLRSALDGRPAASDRVASLRRRRSDYESSFHLEELTVEFTGGRALDVIFKDLCHDRLSASVLAAKSFLQHDPRRELRTYQQILSPAGVGPCLLGVAESGFQQRYWLFIEKVDGVELYQVGDLAVWQEVAAWLARLHETFAVCPSPLDAAVPLLAYDRAWFESLLRGAMQRGSPALEQLAASLAPLFEELLEELDAWPPTLVHGDFYASNILIRSGGADQRVVPVDWEMAGRGPGLLDLAALTAGAWTRAERHAIAGAYYETLARLRQEIPPPRRFRRALDGCRLLLDLRWLTMPDDWKPPPAQTQDWLAEAKEIAGSLNAVREMGGA